MTDMGDVLLYLWPNRRAHMLDELEFYLTQADKRVLVQFGNLEEEADQFARDAFDEMGRYAGPDADPGDYADTAWSKGVDHYQMLTGLHDRLILSVAAGLYHEWEKQVRGWLVQELNHSFPKETLGPVIWKRNMNDLLDLLKCLGWDAVATALFPVIDECRLVVNVSKHGLGTSFNELKANFPHHLGPVPLAGSFEEKFDIRDHTNLKITREDLGRFQQALKDFWAAVPEHIMWDSAATVPSWFEKALTRKY